MYILLSTSSQFIIFYRNTNGPFLLAPAKFYICMLYQSPFMVPNAGVGNRLIKNNLRIFLGSRFNIFKNIEAQKKLILIKKVCNVKYLILAYLPPPPFPTYTHIYYETRGMVKRRRFYWRIKLSQYKTLIKTPIPTVLQNSNLVPQRG